MKIALFYFTVKVVLILFMMISFVQADTLVSSDEALHAAAHVGTSYLITHATEVICTKIAGKKHKLGCLVTGVATSAAAGVFKEVVLDKGESNRRHAIGYTEDAVGIGAAVTIISIDW